MIKNFLSVFAVAGALLLASCSSEPSDLRPETKVSTDSVPPGMRNNTYNVGDRAIHDDVYLNHDEHANEIGRDVEGIPESQQTNETETIKNH